MFKNLGLGIKAFLLFLLVLFLHYNLPQHDIVRVVGTEVTRVDKSDGSFGSGQADAGNNRLETIDVRYINTKRPNGKASVYRNQDTGWGWPPYFKFDTGDLMADAQDLANRHKDGEEIWVDVKHYGWRIKLFSLYPNAITIKDVDGPNDRIIPYFNIVFLTMLFILCLWVWLAWRRFRKKRIDPVTDKIDKHIDAAADKIDAAKDAAGKEFTDSQSGFRAFLRKWFGSK